MLEYRIYQLPEEKTVIKEEFQDFFATVYGRNLSDNDWEHQFLHSPYNDSPLFVTRYDGIIVGSALMIRQKIMIKEQILDYFLFTTSAIHEGYRNLGIYPELLKMQKDYATNSKASFIFAFPNEVAYPVLKLFGRFKLLAKINLGYIKIKDLQLDSIKNSLLIDEKMFNWRFEHKSYQFVKLKDFILVVKVFNDVLDLLGVYPFSSFNDFAIEYQECTDLNKSLFADLSYVSSEHDDIHIEQTLKATYFITSPVFDESNMINEIAVNLLMSDVY